MVIISSIIGFELSYVEYVKDNIFLNFKKDYNHHILENIFNFQCGNNNIIHNLNDENIKIYFLHPQIERYYQFTTRSVRIKIITHCLFKTNKKHVNYTLLFQNTLSHLSCSFCSNFK